MDLSPIFNELLQKHNAPPLRPHPFRIQDVDEFLKEAYRINEHIASLNAYLRSIRQSYLSTAQPPRRKHTAHTDSPHLLPTPDKDRKYLTDAQRTQIDAETKQVLRQLNAAISNLAEAEAARQTISTQIALKKRARHGLGALGRWAAGGAATAKSPEEEAEEARANGVKVHRESVIWYLQRKLEECGRVQSRMMEIRLTREVERSKSALYKARGVVLPVEGGGDVNGDYSGGVAVGGNRYRGGQGVRMEEADRQGAEGQQQELSPELLQQFAQENNEMLKHYEDTLDQVRTAERSLLEISELQTTLANNLAVQQEHIDQLVEDSYRTAENVGSGNKQLKQASERKGTARMVFYGTCLFCSTLILWDFLI